MFLLIDNYDSFTYNLWHFFGELGAEVAVFRNDRISVRDALALEPEGIVISPGPCNPDHTGICLDLIAEVPATMPILGVCLGHQCIGQVFGGQIVRAPEPMHGKRSQISHHGDGLFREIPAGFTATRYHSLVIERSTIPDELRVTAEADDLIMGIEHVDRPVFGLQFHPESIATENGYRLLANFLERAGSGVNPVRPIGILEQTLVKSAS